MFERGTTVLGICPYPPEGVPLACAKYPYAAFLLMVPFPQAHQQYCMFLEAYLELELELESELELEPYLALELEMGLEFEPKEEELEM